MTDLTAHSTGSMDIQQIMATRPANEFTKAKALTTAHSTIIADDVIMHMSVMVMIWRNRPGYRPLAKRTKR